MSDNNREKLVNMTVADALRKIETGGEESLSLLRMIESNTKPAVMGKAVKNALPGQLFAKNSVKPRDTSGRFAPSKPTAKNTGNESQAHAKTLSQILKGGVAKTWQNKKDDVKDIAGRTALGPLWDIGKEIKETFQSAREKSGEGAFGELKAWGSAKFGKKTDGNVKPAFKDSIKRGADGKISMRPTAQNAKGIAGGGGMITRGTGAIARGARGAMGGLAALAGPLMSGISLPLVAAAGAAAFGVQQFAKALTTGESDVYNWLKKITGYDPSKETQSDRDKAAKVDQANLDQLNKGRAPGREMIRTADGGVIRADAKQNLELTAQELRKKGMSEQMVTASVANLQKESGGIARTENMNYKNQPNDRIRTVFGSSTKGMSDEKLTALKNGPEDQFAEAMYGNSTKKGRDMGNTEAGDGYKFRGRGTVQLTGKANYAKQSQELFGDDRMVKNPELANDPANAAKISANFISKNQKSAAAKLGLDVNTTNQSEANKIATQAVVGNGVDLKSGRGAEQLAIVNKYAAGSVAQGVAAPGATKRKKSTVAAANPSEQSSGGQKASAAGPATTEVVAESSKSQTPTATPTKAIPPAAMTQPAEESPVATADSPATVAPKQAIAIQQTDKPASTAPTAAPAAPAYNKQAHEQAMADQDAAREKLKVNPKDSEAQNALMKATDDVRAQRKLETEAAAPAAKAAWDSEVANANKGNNYGADESGIDPRFMSSGADIPKYGATSPSPATAAGQADYKTPPAPQPSQPLPTSIQGMDKVVTAMSQKDSGSSSNDKSKDSGSNPILPNIPTEFSDTQLTLMAYDRI